MPRHGAASALFVDSVTLSVGHATRRTDTHRHGDSTTENQQHDHHLPARHRQHDDRGRAGPGRHPSHPDQPSRDQGHPSSGSCQRAFGRATAHDRYGEHVREPARRRIGHHMSRFVQLLNEHDRPIDATNFGAMVTAMVDRLDAEDGHIEMSFPYFVTKFAPVSGVPSTLDYEVTFVGKKVAGRIDTWIKVLVGATSLCPCSKATLVSHGATQPALAHHDEREGRRRDVARGSHRDRRTGGLLRTLGCPEARRREVRDRACLRESEVRRGPTRCRRSTHLPIPDRAYSVESENFESIHNHSAYARIDVDKDFEVAGGPGGNRTHDRAIMSRT